LAAVEILLTEAKIKHDELLALISQLSAEIEELREA